MLPYKGGSSKPVKGSLKDVFRKDALPRSFFLLALVVGLMGAWPLAPRLLNHARAAGSSSIPIKHVVFIIKENHSFDNYFGRFPGAHGATTGIVKINGVDQTIKLASLIDQTPDYCHIWKCYTADYDNGAMDHFNRGVCASAPYMCYQAATQDQIPNYWNLATKYVLSDETYASMGGPSFPNRLYTIAAQAGNTVGTSPIAVPSNNGQPTGGWGCDSASGTTVQLYDNTDVYPCFDFSTMADLMDAAGVSWKHYGPLPGQSGYIWNAFDAINHIRNGPDWSQHMAPWSDFAKDALAGNLPAFSWVIPDSTRSEHPPSSTCLGENWTIRQVDAVMQGPDWSSTAIFVTWDEWGGFYDHEAPASVDPLGYGFRVPMIIISPYAHATSNPANPHIVHTLYQASSVLRFAEEVFGLPSMNRRDAIANDMMDAFDFSQVWNAPDVLAIRTCGSTAPVHMQDES